MKLLWILAATILCTACLAQYPEFPHDSAERERLVKNLLEQVTHQTTSSSKIMPVNQLFNTTTPTTPEQPVIVISNSTEFNSTTESEIPAERIHHKKGCRGRFQGDQNNQTENGQMSGRHPHRREDIEDENSQNQRFSRDSEGRQERRHDRDNGREGKPHHREEEHSRPRGQINQYGPEETVNSSSSSKDSQNLLSQPDSSRQQPPQDENYPQRNPNKRHPRLSKGVRIALIVVGSIIGLVILVRLVRCCRRRRLARKQRKEAILQAAQSLQTQQTLINHNNHNSSVSIGHPLLPNQPISLGHPYNPYQQQVVYLPYPCQVPQQDQQQQKNDVQGEQIGEPISAPAPQHHQYLHHAISAPHQNFMQIQIPQIQPQQFVPQKQEPIVELDSNNNQVRYPVLAPLNLGGVQQVPFQYGYPQQYSQQ